MGWSRTLGKAGYNACPRARRWGRMASRGGKFKPFPLKILKYNKVVITRCGDVGEYF